MAFKRLVKKEILASEVKRYGNRRESNNRIRLIILLAYYRFLDEMALRAQRTALRERAANVHPQHIRIATQRIFQRLKSYNPYKSHR